MPPKRKKRFHGLYYHSSPPRVLPMNGQASSEIKKKSADDFSVRLSTIRIWMHEKDIGKLTRVLWSGQGNRLRQQASTNPRVKRFLAAVPYVMNTIKDVHQSVIDNSLETLQSTMEPPVPPSLITCKDSNGLNVIHKAAGLGHTMILEYLLGIWPDGAHETDMTGKTPLHWAASAKNNMRCYTLLTQAGCEEDVLDYKMKTPAYYKQKHNEIERSFLTLVPDAPRVSQDIPCDWEALANDDSDDRKKPEIKIPNGRRRSDITGNALNLLTSRSEANSIENTSEPDLSEGVNGNDELPEPPSEEPEVNGVDEPALENGHLTNGNDSISEPPTPPQTPDEKPDEEEKVEMVDEPQAPEKENVSNALNEQNNEDANGFNESEDKTDEDNSEGHRSEDGNRGDNDKIEKSEDGKLESSVEDENKNEEEKEENNDDHAESTNEGIEATAEDTEARDHSENGEKADPEEKTDATEIDKENEQKDKEENEEEKEEEEKVDEKEDEIEKEEEKETEDKKEEEDFKEKKEETDEKIEEQYDVANQEGNSSENKTEEIDNDTNQETVPDPGEVNQNETENEPEAPQSTEIQHEEPQQDDEEIQKPTQSDDANDKEKDNKNKDEPDKEHRKENDDDDDDQDVELIPVEPPEQLQLDENDNLPEFDDKMTTDSPTSSLAIEGFVLGDSEDNQVQSESAAYLDDEEKYIQAIIDSGDMEQLAALVLNGDGKKILNRTSTQPEIQAFLHNVPAYMSKISRVHEAARQGTLYQLQSALDRRKFAIAKDEMSPCGASPLHVAVLFGHSDIVRYLAGRFPETTSAVDDDGRTALHYAATIKDNGHFFNLLSHLGGNPKATDKFGHTADFYTNEDHAKSVLTYKQLLRRFGAETLEEEMLSDQGLGDPLIKGLTEIAEKRPVDPVAYLAGFLQNFIRSRSHSDETNDIDTNSTAVVKSEPEAMASPKKAKRIDSALVEERVSSPESTPKNEDRDEHGQSMLHFACARSHRRNGLLNLIEESQIDVTYRDELYRTARDVSLQANQPGNAKEIDRYVLSLAVVGDTKPFEHMAYAGYDHILDVVDDDGTSISDVADSRGHDKLLEFFNDLRNLEETREELHQAIRDGDFEKVKEITATQKGKWLIKAKNYYGRTAMHIAVLKELDEMVEYFVNTCPDALKIGDNLERTALHYAMGTNSVEGVSRVLIRKGAKRTIKDLKGRQPSYYFMNKADILRLQEEEDEHR